MEQKSITFTLNEQEFTFVYNAVGNTQISSKDASFVADLQKKLFEIAKAEAEKESSPKE